MYTTSTIAQHVRNFTKSDFKVHNGSFYFEFDKGTMRIANRAKQDNGYKPKSSILIDVVLNSNADIAKRVSEILTLFVNSDLYSGRIKKWTR